MSTKHADHPRSRAGWVALRALLALESLALAVVAGISVFVALGSRDAQAQIASITVFVLLALVWVVVTLAGAIRGRASWVRGSALTIHVLLFAVGTGSLQQAIGPWWVGLAVVLTALTGFAAAVLARPSAADLPGSA